jgi:hypothetical protein
MPYRCPLPSESEPDSSSSIAGSSFFINYAIKYNYHS